MSLQFFAHALCFGGAINNQAVHSMRIPLRSIFYFLLHGNLLDISTYIFCCHLKTTLSGFISASVAKVLELSDTTLSFTLLSHQLIILLTFFLIIFIFPIPTVTF